MTIPVVCVCGPTYQISDQFAGRQVRCPQCGQVLTIPEPVPAPPPPDPVPAFMPVAIPESEPDPPPPAPEVPEAGRPDWQSGPNVAGLKIRPTIRRVGIMLLVFLIGVGGGSLLRQLLGPKEVQTADAGKPIAEVPEPIEERQPPPPPVPVLPPPVPVPPPPVPIPPPTPVPVPPPPPPPPPPPAPVPPFDLPGLINSLGRPVDRARQVLAGLVTAGREAVALPRLLHDLDHPDAGVRRAAEALLARTDPAAIDRAVAVLLRMDPAQAQKAVPFLVRGLRQEEPVSAESRARVRQMTETLSRIGRPAVAELITALEGDYSLGSSMTSLGQRNAEARLAIVAILAEIGSQGKPPEVLRVLTRLEGRDPDPEIRQAARRARIRIQNPK